MAINISIDASTSSNQFNRSRPNFKSGATTMAHYSPAARVTRDVIFFVLMMAFTAGRIIHGRKRWWFKKVPNKFPEIIASSCLILATVITVPIIGLAMEDIVIVMRLKTAEQILKYNLEPRTNLVIILDSYC